MLIINIKKPKYTNKVPGSDFTCKPVEGIIFITLKECPLRKNSSPTRISDIKFLLESYTDNLPVKSCNTNKAFSTDIDVDWDKFEIQNLLFDKVSTKVKGISTILSLSILITIPVIHQSVW